MANVDMNRIAGNISASNALTELSRINKQLSIHQTRLASGKRINTAEDDPAGLTIATKLNTRVEGLNVALGNIGDAKNLLSVAESGLSRINDILLQMRNKAEVGASDTVGADERAAINQQMTEFSNQITNLVENTKWNGTALLDGNGADGAGGPFRFQVGADETDNISMTAIASMAVADLAIDTIPAGTDDAATFAAYMTTLNDAMDTVNVEMTKVGAMMGRLSFKEDQVMAGKLNVEASYNRIMNADMAEEQVQASKLNILQQTSTAMLAQANAAPQFLMSLFR